MISKLKRALKRLLKKAPPADPLKGLEPVDIVLMRRIQASRLTYLADNKLVSLVMTCRRIESSGLKGIFMEAGCALGGSIILDDYHDWGGCKKATDEFLQTVVGQFALDDSAKSMKITRVRFDSIPPPTLSPMHALGRFRPAPTKAIS